MKQLRSILPVLSIVVAVALPAHAWGTGGHVIINGAAMSALPDALPAFLKTPAAAAEVAALGPELDRLKGSGRPHDSDEDPGHYVDIDDTNMVGGVVALNALPASRQDYDTALRGMGTNQYKEGYLPYAIIDGMQQITKDFAYWRADDASAKNPATTAADRAWFEQDRQLRETLTLRDIGVIGHYIGDASQPLHVTIHFNGWGKYPNPKNYSTSQTLHARFESDFVRSSANVDQVRKKIAPYASCGCTLEQHVARYLAATLAKMPAVYEFEAQGAIDHPTPASIDLMQSQLAAGAAMMRDLIVDAWTESASAKIAYPPIPVSDIESGKVVLTRQRMGGD